VNLTEEQGKTLFARYGVPVPRGALWGDLRLPEMEFPLIAKTQILSGRRGKRGGVRIVASIGDLDEAVARFMEGTDLLPAALGVLVEEKLDIEREHYIAVVVDRERRVPVLIAHRDGGVEIEAQAASGFLRIEMRPSVGITPTDVQAVIAHLGLVGERATQLAAVVAALWQVFEQEDCLLAEINPLVVTASGRVVAADARVVVDDSAARRHLDWPKNETGTEFEKAVSAAGAVGTELDGDVAIVTSGAGLGMSTLDLVAATGIRASCLVDLAGVVFQGAAALGQVFACTAGLRPRVLFVNAFLQAAPCDDLALGFLAARDQLRHQRIVMRLRGRRAEQARALLADHDVFVTEDLHAALAEVTAVAAFDSASVEGPA